MNKTKILIVDDEPDILEMASYSFTKEGFAVYTARDGITAIKECERILPDIIVLDLMLPGMDGSQICYKLKKHPQLNHIPIIMLTAKTDETDEVVGLKIGADDYITKPFSLRVLNARVNAVLRRRVLPSTPPAENEETIIHNNLTVAPARHEVKVGADSIKLTPIEFNILLFLIRHPGWVFTRPQIIAAIRGGDIFITERTVDVHIASLRKKLGDAGSVIDTVHGVGYKIRA